MSNSVKALAALAFLVVVAACAQRSAPVVTAQPALTVEPVYTGKYK